MGRYGEISGGTRSPGMPEIWGDMGGIWKDMGTRRLGCPTGRSTGSCLFTEPGSQLTSLRLTAERAEAGICRSEAEASRRRRRARPPVSPRSRQLGRRETSAILGGPRRTSADLGQSGLVTPILATLGQPRRISASVGTPGISRPTSARLCLSPAFSPTSSVSPTERWPSHSVTSESSEMVRSMVPRRFLEGS